MGGAQSGRDPGHWPAGEGVVSKTVEGYYSQTGAGNGATWKHAKIEEAKLMKWKFLGVLVATMVFCASGMAQDYKAFLGIWQINKEKTTNYAQQSQMIINIPSPNGFISTRAQIGKENTQSSTEIHPVVFDGQPQQTSGGDARTISYKLVDPHTIERTQNRGGKISMDTEQVSADGKTLTVTQNGVVRIYDKVADVRPVH
jgi:hypothetical protein